MKNTLFINQNYYACFAHETSKTLYFVVCLFKYRQAMSEIEVLQDMHANWKNHNKNQLQNGLTILETSFLLDILRRGVI